MNFNVANLGSLPTDLIPAFDGKLDFANPDDAGDDHFAHILNNESKRADQTGTDAKGKDAKDRHAAARNERNEDRARTEQSRQERTDKLVEAKQSEADRQRTEETGTEKKQAHAEQVDDKRPDAAEQHEPAERPNDGQREEHAKAEQPETDAPPADRAETGAEGDAPAQQTGDDGNAPRQAQDHPEIAEQQAVSNIGQQIADAARTAAATAIEQPKASETLINLANRTTPRPLPLSQAGLPGNGDPLANGTLPSPLQNKLSAGGNKGKNEGAGKSEENAQKLAQQALAQAQAKLQATPHMRGGAVKHGGDILPDPLPRPQTGPLSTGNAFGQHLANATHSPAGPASIVSPAHAAHAASVANSDGHATIQNLHVPVSTERAAQAELPTLTVRTDGNPTPTPPSPQAMTGLSMEGDGKPGLTGLGDEGGKPGGNGTNSVGTASNTSASGAKAASIVQQHAAADVRSPGIQVAMQLSKAVQNGMDRMTIRLDPADMGRVHVKLEVGHDGRAIAMVAADRPETLDLLQRDARSLERALQDAGLKTDGQSLSFSLSQGEQQGGALADGSWDGDDDGRVGGDGQDGSEVDREAAGDGGGDLPKVVSNRALDINV